MTLTFNQKIAIILVALGVLTTGSTAGDLATLIGPGAAKSVTALANIIQTMLAGFLAVVTGQTNIIKDAVTMAKDPNSPIQGVITTNNAEGKALAASIEGPISSAGSSSAVEIAKS